jgi:Kef-type K+ transport system membrane component KefB/nucleotide-binding universal stress UspA family protein
MIAADAGWNGAAHRVLVPNGFAPAARLHIPNSIMTPSHPVRALVVRTDLVRVGPRFAKRTWRRANNFLIAVFLLLTSSAAMAAEGGGSAGSGASGSSVAIFFAQIGLLLVIGRAMGEAAQRLGQPAVMGQLIGGLLLGPSVFGLLWPDAQHLLFPKAAEQKSMIDAVSQIGVLMLLLLTGMETDLRLVKRVGRAAITVSIAGVAVPFICGITLGEFLPDSILPNPEARFVTALFLGTALSISSVKIVAMVVREMNFMRRDLGQIIVASAILEDTIGWIIVAIAFGLASAGKIDAWAIGKTVVGTATFLAASLTIGRRIVFSLIRWANDNFQSEFPVITMILVIMIVMALTTNFIGVHTVLGAFVAGILVGESPILTKHIDEQLRGLIVALFMPVFFGMAGLTADLTILKSADLALLALGLVLIASIGKFCGAFFGGKLGGLSRAESLALACGMNARGSTEVIVASIGLSMGVLSQNLFTLIVAMAVITTMAMPPMLRWALKRLPMRKEEKQRLEREELDAKGFVTNLERLLLAKDGSANGKFAANVAGVVAGSGNKPITILDLARTGRDGRSKKPSKDSAEESESKSEQEVKDAAENQTTLEAHPAEEKQGKAEVIKRKHEGEAPEAVAEEAKKGYDLLVVGIEKTRGPKGGFTKDITGITESFEGPLVVAVAGGKDAPVFDQNSRILIPVNGSDVSRRAAEVAFVLARASDARVTGLYVLSTSAANAKRKRGRRGSTTRRNEEAVLKDIAEVGDRYGATIRTAMQVDVAADEAILKEAKRRGYDLIVLGVSRRPGDTLFFGNTALAVLDNSDIPVVFVAS